MSLAAKGIMPPMHHRMPNHVRPPPDCSSSRRSPNTPPQFPHITPLHPLIDTPTIPHLPHHPRRPSPNHASTRNHHPRGQHRSLQDLDPVLDNHHPPDDSPLPNMHMIPNTSSLDNALLPNKGVIPYLQRMIVNNTLMKPAGRT